MPPKDTGPFKHNEKVLVPHTDKHWDAKVVKSEKRENGMWFYYIHYPRWDKEWDEWVEESGLRKWDPKIVESEKGAPGDGKPGGAKGKQKGAPPGAKRGEKRRKVADIAPPTAELPRETGKEPAVSVRLPAALKQVLLDEHEAVKKGLRLPAVPRKPSVSEILQQYVEESRASGQVVDAQEQDATGLRVYFDKALHHCLLYDHEVSEYEEVLADGVVPSSLYGGEHLLRLCAKFPYLVPIAATPSESYDHLQQQLATFVDFLSKHKSSFFLPIGKYTKPKS